MATEYVNVENNAPEPTEPARPSRAKRFLAVVIQPKYGIPLLLIVTLLLSPVVYRGYQLRGLPDVGDPFDVEASGTVNIKPEDNAFVGYEQAAKLLVSPTPSKLASPYLAVREQGWSAATVAFRDSVDKNRPALEAWRQATAKPDALYHQPKDLAIDTPMRHTNYMREFGRMAIVEGLRLESEGDVDASWTLYRALYRSSRHCGRHGCVYERNIGTFLHATSIEPISRWSANRNVTFSMLRQAITHLREDFAMTARESTSLKAEYLKHLNSSTRRHLRPAFAAMAYIPPALTGVGLYAIGEPERYRRVTRQAFANLLEHIDKPHHARPPHHRGRLRLFDSGPVTSMPPKQLTANEIDLHYRKSDISLSTLSVVDELLFGDERALHVALIGALQAQLYYREHGEFPSKLEQLVDSESRAVPTDPYGSAGQAMHYRRDEKSAMIWSVGLNGIDDGGAIDTGPVRRTDVGIRITPPKERQ